MGKSTLTYCKNVEKSWISLKETGAKNKKNVYSFGVKVIYIIVQGLTCFPAC